MSGKSNCKKERNNDTIPFEKSTVERKAQVEILLTTRIKSQENLILQHNTAKGPKNSTGEENEYTLVLSEGLKLMRQNERVAFVVGHRV